MGLFTNATTCPNVAVLAEPNRIQPICLKFPVIQFFLFQHIPGADASCGVAAYDFCSGFVEREASYCSGLFGKLLMQFSGSRVPDANRFVGSAAYQILVCVVKGKGLNAAVVSF